MTTFSMSYSIKVQNIGDW